MTFIIPTFLIIAFHIPFSHSILLDIHLPLTKGLQSCVYDEALRWNLALQKQDEHEFIDFEYMHTPHVTLYLADFNLENDKDSKIFIDSTFSGDDNRIISTNQTKLDALEDAIKTAIGEIKKEMETNTQEEAQNKFAYPCLLPITTSVMNGAYTMLNIQKNRCLQYLSDKIVNHTQSFVHFPSPIPEWVYHIPNSNERSKKIALIEKYGSPNVFEGFDPHVTVGYNVNCTNVMNCNDRKALVKKLQAETPANCVQDDTYMTLGYTSLGGTVLRAGEIIDVDLRLNESHNSKGLEKVKADIY